MRSSLHKGIFTERFFRRLSNIKWLIDPFNDLYILFPMPRFKGFITKLVHLLSAQYVKFVLVSQKKMPIFSFGLL